jgi:serine/threonine protein kinase
MMRVSSPYVVALIDKVRTSNFVYVVMEYCAGGDLEAYVKRGKVSEALAKRWLGNLLDAFATLHQLKVLHRDLKLANILLSETDDSVAVAKVADFGFARFASETSLAETMLGTPMFMAPEILGRTPYNYKVDVWSLGVIAYEIMVGRQIFVVYSMEELIEAQKRPIEFPANCGLSDDAKSLIVLMLKYRPSDRPTFEVVRAHSFFQEPKPSPELLLPAPLLPSIPEEPPALPSDTEQLPVPLPVSPEADATPLPVSDPVPSVSQPQVPAVPEEEKKDSLINEYDMIDGEEDDQQLAKNFSLVEDSQFNPLAKAAPTTHCEPIPEADEAIHQSAALEKPAELPQEEEIQLRITPEENPPQPETVPLSMSARNEDMLRDEMLRLDYKCSNELEATNLLAQKYLKEGKNLLAFAIYWTFNKALKQCFYRFNKCCQDLGFVRETATEVAQIYEKLQISIMTSDTELSSIQTKLTTEDLTRSVMKYEDEGLRIEGRLILQEARDRYNAIQRSGAEGQIAGLKEIMTLLSIAMSDAGAEEEAGKLLETCRTQLTTLLEAAFMA